jgi:hypothetical protein
VSGTGGGGDVILARIAAVNLQALLKEKARVEARCPWCGQNQDWWMSRAAVGNKRGLFCFDVECGFRLDLPPGPPAILCSHCGEPLQRDDGCYRCKCGREVRPPETVRSTS